MFKLYKTEIIASIIFFCVIVGGIFLMTKLVKYDYEKVAKKAEDNRNSENVINDKYQLQELIGKDKRYSSGFIIYTFTYKEREYLVNNRGGIIEVK